MWPNNIINTLLGPDSDSTNRFERHTNRTVEHVKRTTEVDRHMNPLLKRIKSIHCHGGRTVWMWSRQNFECRISKMHERVGIRSLRVSIYFNVNSSQEMQTNDLRQCAIFLKLETRTPKTASHTPTACADEPQLNMYVNHLKQLCLPRLKSSSNGG